MQRSVGAGIILFILVAWNAAAASYVMTTGGGANVAGTSIDLDGDAIVDFAYYFCGPNCPAIRSYNGWTYGSPSYAVGAWENQTYDYASTATYNIPSSTGGFGFDWNGANPTYASTLEVFLIRSSLNRYYKLRLTAIDTSDLNPATIEVVELVGPASDDDFSGDGKSDLFWRQPSTGKNVWWAMDGANRLGYGNLLDVPGTAWSLAGTGHFNGDADPDLVWRNSITGQNVAWGMDGTTRTSYAYLLTVPSPWEIGGIDDFDGDGDADIVWRNPSSGQNVLWTMNGIVRQSFTTMLTVIGSQWRIGGVGDFDADGKPDLVWRNSTTGQNVIWFMDGANRTSFASTLTVVGEAWRIQAVADYDGDGKADIVWRNVSTGQNVIWFMDGATRDSFASTLSVPVLSWEMQSPK